MTRMVMCTTVLAAQAVLTVAQVPVPNERQLDFMELELTQFK